MAYKSDKLNLQSQSIAGVRHWSYTDTGSALAAVSDAGFFSDGRTKGMKVGDVVFFTSAGATPTSDTFVVTDVQADDTGGQYASVGDTG
ncbi:hypothetical protein [Aquamicrobium sp.]|uniref:hypothetical protein n=1 Tax=Aquamicrobium sp. TaxID=1872579 RepID=UPI00258F6B27|nr:hypothetical protein [Aquamicrobium sp.]MCK9549136.1 hypothetical protein [Aquamicrobium sp.]